MKLMNKIMLSIIAASALAPVSTQANPFTRVIIKQNLLAVAKNPGVIMAAFGGASLLASRKLNNKAKEIQVPKSDPAFATKARYSTAAYVSKLMGKGFTAVGLNYAGLTALNRAGYITKIDPKDANAVCIALLNLLFAEYACRNYMHSSKILYGQDLARMPRREKILHGAAQFTVREALLVLLMYPFCVS